MAKQDALEVNLNRPSFSSRLEFSKSSFGKRPLLAESGHLYEESSTMLYLALKLGSSPKERHSIICGRIDLLT